MTKLNTAYQEKLIQSGKQKAEGKGIERFLLLLGRTDPFQ